MKWDKRFMDLAHLVASWSEDMSTHVGCVIVDFDHTILSTGYNGLPRGVEAVPERLERPAKYTWTSHAEENAVANAARVGVSLLGATAYVTHLPCAACARLLVQAGVRRVVVDRSGKTSMECLGDHVLHSVNVVVEYL